jgi:hypothetical protein
MALLLDAGARAVVAGEEAGEGRVRQHGPFPSTWAAAGERSRTLDDLLSGAWQGLTAASSAACPVCQGELEPRWSAGAGVVGGRCRDCDSELS